MAFTYSLDDFAVTFFVTGNGFTTLSVEIYSRARQGISLSINALSALVFLLVCSWSSVITLLPVKRRKQHEKTYSFLTGIVLVILVLWGISHQIEASMIPRIVTSWSSTTGEIISIQNC